MKILTVNDKFDNKKLISLLISEFPEASQNTFYKALRKKDIRINDKRISENVTIHTGDNIKIFILDQYLLPTLPNLSIAYEDENILIVNKPKNIEVTGENSLTTILLQNDKYAFCKIYPCHRLDRNTSGLVIFAKSEHAFRILTNKFKNHEITKFYKCKAYGIFNKKHDILSAYLFKDKKKSLVYISNNCKNGYKNIITEYKVLEEYIKDNYSILEIILHTGRTHQIRAHLAHIGHPIIGDRKVWK